MSPIAIGISLHNPISPRPPVNAVPITIENGTEFWEKPYRTLELCEKKGYRRPVPRDRPTGWTW